MEGIRHLSINKFLKEYEKHPCLWNKAHSKFKDRTERDKAERSLMEFTNIYHITNLRKKIRSIRGTYNTEIRKMKRFRNSGAGASKDYVPKLSWFATADRFLRTTTETERFAISNVASVIKEEEYDSVATNTPEGSTNEYLTCPTFNKTTPNLQKTHNEEENDTVTSIYTNETSEESTNEDPTPPPTHTMSKTKKAIFHRTHQINKSLRRVKKISRRRRNSEFMVFGHSIAIQLQTLPLELALQLQADIQLLITQTRLHYLKTSSAQSSFNSPQASSTQQAEHFDHSNIENEDKHIVFEEIGPQL